MQTVSLETSQVVVYLGAQKLANFSKGLEKTNSVLKDYVAYTNALEMRH